MINTEADPAAADSEVADLIERWGMRGAVAVAGIATTIVIGLWIAFYLLVFVPRGGM